MVKKRRKIAHGGLLLSPKLLISIYDYYSSLRCFDGTVFPRRKMWRGLRWMQYANDRARIQDKQCGSVHYCSRACQVWHWPHHKACCESPEQRAIRLENLEKARPNVKRNCVVMTSVFLANAKRRRPTKRSARKDPARADPHQNQTGRRDCEAGRHDGGTHAVSCEEQVAICNSLRGRRNDSYAVGF